MTVGQRRNAGCFYCRCCQIMGNVLSTPGIVYYLTSFDVNNEQFSRYPKGKHSRNGSSSVIVRCCQS